MATSGLRCVDQRSRHSDRLFQFQQLLDAVPSSNGNDTAQLPKWLIGFASALVALESTAPAFALEYPIGKPPIRAGIEVSADKETGVGPRFQPFTLDYEFPFTGVGKKGGY